MKEKPRLPFFLAVSALSFGLALGGCGGGSSTTALSNDNQQISPSAVSGTVADGYLEEALVCLDVDLDGLCTDADPTVYSGENGVYTISSEMLEDFGIADPSLYPIIAKTVPGQTIDLDAPGVFLDKEVVLKSPAGKPEFVSPITTMVQKKIEAARASGITKTAEDAAGEVVADLGMAINPFVDYVAEKEKEGGEVYDKVHMVAQAVTRTMMTMQVNFKNVAGDQVNLDLIVNAVIEKVMEQLPAILSDVDTAKNDGLNSKTYNTDTIVTNISTNITSTEIAAALDKAQAEKEMVKSSFQQLLENGGSYWLEGWIEPNGMVNFEHSIIRYEGGVLSEEEYEYLDGNWQPLVDEGDDAWHILTSDGWVAYDDGPEHYDVAFNDDGTATITHKTLGLTETVSVIEYDLAGKRHMGFAGYVAQFLVDENAIFPEGAKAFKLTFTPHQDIYELDSWVDDSGKDWNYVRYYDQNYREHTVTTLDGLLDVFSEDLPDTYFLPIGYSESNVNLGLKFSDDGSLHCYEVPWNYGEMPVRLDLTGTWRVVTVNNERLLKVMIPAMYKKKWGIDYVPFFAEFNGVVKSGEYLAANVPVADSGYEFNEAAFNSLTENLDFNYQPQADPGDEGTPPPATLPLPADLLTDNTYYVYLSPGEEEIFTFTTTESPDVGTVIATWSAEPEASATAAWSLDEQGVLTILFDTPDPENNAVGVRIELIENTADFIRILSQDFDANGGFLGTPEVETWFKEPQTIVN